MAKKHGGPRRRAGRRPGDKTTKVDQHRDGRSRMLFNLDEDDRRRLDQMRERRGYKDKADVLRIALREQIEIWDKLTAAQKHKLDLPDVPTFGEYKPYQFWATEEERANITKLRNCYGFDTDINVIRFVIREAHGRAAA